MSIQSLTQSIKINSSRHGSEIVQQDDFNSLSYENLLYLVTKDELEVKEIDLFLAVERYSKLCIAYQNSSGLNWKYSLI